VVTAHYAFRVVASLQTNSVLLPRCKGATQVGGGGTGRGTAEAEERRCSTGSLLSYVPASRDFSPGVLQFRRWLLSALGLTS
jgi:hypothetical protein